MEIKRLFKHKSTSNRWFTNGIHCLLNRAVMPERALISFTVCDACRYFV